jgi:hypothetical protein
LKAGFCGLELVVSREAVRVQAVGRIAHTLIGGMEPELDPRLCTMAIERIGVFGSNIAARDSILVSCNDLNGDQRVALRPRRGTVADVWRALRDAGVQPLGQSP